MNETENTPEEPINPLFLAEFFCWTMVVLAPILTWVNGPSVSTDQFVVRVSVFVLALAGAIGLRVAKMIRGRRNKGCLNAQTREVP
jgi:hypothetical protein